MADRSAAKRNPLLAFVLGLLLPGLGLLYAAPWLVAAGGTLAVFVIWKLFAWIPLLGTVVVALLALGSGTLNMLYARAYNRLGERPKLVLPERATR